MNSLLKVLLIVFFSFSIISCERISQKIDQKINEEVDRKIEESLQKIDSIISKDNLDSIKTKIDSAIKKTKEKLNK